MIIDQAKLKDFIIDSGLISKAYVDAAEKEVKEKKEAFSSALLRLGGISEENLRKMEAYVIGIPFVDLKGQRIPFEILSMIPEPIARRHSTIAFRKTKDGLEVAMLDIDDLESISFIQKKTQLKILPRLTDKESIKSVLIQYQKSLKEEFGDIIQRESDSLKGGVAGELSAEDLKKMATDLPVVRIVDTLLSHAIVQNVSDIHIEPQEQQLLVRYRIDGILHEAMVLPKSSGPAITARIKVLTRLKLDEKRLPQDGRFKIEKPEPVSFRVSTLPTYFGEKVVMRLLKESTAGFTLEKLGFHGEGLESIHDSLRQKTGMILATGPTGSGKTTTLYTLLDMLNTVDVNISTIEDPIEYQMKRINQTQVKSEIGLSFSNGLRTLVRQDPDIIMVGEIRDNETAALAINASLTGHLVLSTLHTNSAAGAIPRLIDMMVEPFLIVSTIKVIIAQRLVRRLHKRKTRYQLSQSEQKSLSKIADIDRLLKIMRAEQIIGPKDTLETISFYKPNISADSEDGYSGRVGIHEVLKISPTIKESIVGNKTADEIEKLAKSEGMLTMIEDGIIKATQGVTTIEEVLRVVSE
jgi:type IV pilus assembly protein PilB